MLIKKSVKVNVFANYVGQAYATLIGVVIYPLYLQFMGAEAYGLVGFFMTLQAWLGILDIGFSPMLNREIAMARAKPEKQSSFRVLLRSVEFVFAVLSIAVAGSIALASDWVSAHWLKVQTLDLSSVAFCIGCMGAIIGLRFFSTLYRSGLSGLEAQLTLNTFNVFVASLKSLGSLAVLRFVGSKPETFFMYQLGVALLEPFALHILFYRNLSSFGKPVGFVFSFNSLKQALPFGLRVAYTSGIWAAVTQIDKLVLSNILPLKEYGYFAIVAMISSGVMQLSGPIGNAVLPRMTYLVSSGREKEMLQLYSKTSQILAVVMFPVTGMVGLFGHQLILAWTGDASAAIWCSPILTLYMIGNAFLSILSTQYFLQYAYGRLKIHVLIHTVLLFIAPISIALTAYAYGPKGTAIAWICLHFACFCISPMIVHKIFAPGLHARWLFHDLLPVALTTSLGLLIMAQIPSQFWAQLSRLSTFGVLFSMGTIVLACGMAGSQYGRAIGVAFVKRGMGRE